MFTIYIYMHTRHPTNPPSEVELRTRALECAGLPWGPVAGEVGGLLVLLKMLGREGG